DETMERENMWKQYSPEQLAELEEVSSRYKECLNLGKTERECVALAISMAEAKGYKNLKDCIAGREELHPGPLCSPSGFYTPLPRPWKLQAPHIPAPFCPNSGTPYTGCLPLPILQAVQENTVSTYFPVPLFH